MRRGLEVTGWLVGLFGAGLGVIAVSRATAPPATDGDIVDSDLYLPLTFVLAVVALGAGYRLPRLALGLGVVAVLPYIAFVFGIGYSLTAEQEASRLMYVFFTLPVAVIPVVGAVGGSVLRRHRERKKGPVASVSS